MGPRLARVHRPGDASASPGLLFSATWRTTMKVMVFVKATPESEKGVQPDPAMFAAMDKFNDELTKAGIMITCDGLKPSSEGKRVAFDGSSRKVINGPFTHSTDLVAGFWLWNVKDMDEAVAWVKRCPNPMPGPSEIEIRPIETDVG
jgi:hypothetical protein